MFYELYKDSQSYWRWRLKAANGEIIANGEAYYNKADCAKVIQLLKASAAAPVREI